MSGWAWTAVVVVVLVAVAGTARMAVGELRVPMRAARSTWPYTYGVSAAATDGADAGYRKTRKKVVAVVDASSRWLALTVRLDGAGTEPADVRVDVNGETALKGRLGNAAPLTAVVELPVGTARVLVESVSGFASGGSQQERSADPPLLMKWEFLDRAPAHITGYPRAIPG